MSTFPNPNTNPSVPYPSYGISKTSKPNIKRVQFADGFEARISFGMHQNAKTWNPTWDNITEAESDAIESFLDQRANDADSFTWTPPNESSSGKYICNDWTKQINVAGYATITATFEEVFEP